ncbi:Spermidine/putrescine-binding periplasmic protein 1 [Gluconacetobacter sp. SXCC-1]|uniref:extracellular solute-binding protein n=1 Tax=Komagataeibacter rhaeticus TaxID=215221 RepID=UPI000207FF72|nr:extracellular solute-binding protein [Komagataeibacter rhaeticus]ATU71606.1 spermidine/putrescine ABC transporter substrate-binding protein [Komagataeibacter xylinus]EGG77709.1 Spermidine/putrescine-binding periplasmic protein 1 [Gluconacetobacter sp. SXCC-1]WPP21298.1 extracellular solute-binding protein [Komagataeibacter rhaeticus]
MSACSRRGALAATTAFMVLAMLPLPAARAADDVLNVLTWCDHEDPELLGPFEQANRVRVHFKDIDSTDATRAILRQAQAADWDVVIMEETAAPQLAEAGLLMPLDPADFPDNGTAPAIGDPATGSYGGRLYAVPEKYGFNAVAFNRARVSATDMEDINAIWQPRYHGRIAIYDSYLPVLSYIALALGLDPARLNPADLPALQAKLATLRASAPIVGDIATVQQALADGQVDIVVGGGAWTTAGVGEGGTPAQAGSSPTDPRHPDLTFTVPRQGAMRWLHGISIAAASQRKALAVAFAQYLRTPAAQARLATSSCYWGMPASTRAPLDEATRAALHWDQQATYLAASHPYPTPDDGMDARLRAVWDRVMRDDAPPPPAATDGTDSRDAGAKAATQP